MNVISVSLFMFLSFKTNICTNLLINCNFQRFACGNIWFKLQYCCTKRNSKEFEVSGNKTKKFCDGFFRPIRKVI